MELLKVIGCGALVIVAISAWLVSCFKLGFMAADWGNKRSEALGWFAYLATVGFLLFAGFSTFAYFAAKATGEI